MTTNESSFSSDLGNRKITVIRPFDAALEQVWKAWTESEILDLWWAPQPYRAETKSMDFREGGQWLYAMAGPEGDKQWCLEKYQTIEPHKRITSYDMFCDENGNKKVDMPTMNWEKKFNGAGNRTTVTIELTFDKEEEMQKIIEMGFEEGFKAGLNNLDRVLRTGK